MNAKPERRSRPSTGITFGVRAKRHGSAAAQRLAEALRQAASLCRPSHRPESKFLSCFRRAAGVVALATASCFGEVEILPTGGRNVWQLAAAELDGDRASVEFAGGTYDGRVCAFRADGTVLWEARTGGFVFCLAAGDLDGDGRDEIVAASADNRVHVFGSAGRLRWSSDLRAPVTQVAIARLDGRAPNVIAGGASLRLHGWTAKGEETATIALEGYLGVLHAADFDGDGADELLVMTLRNSPPGGPYSLRVLKGSQLRPVYAAQRAPEPFITTQHAFACTTADVDGDGRAEVITPAGAVRVGETLTRMAAFEKAVFPPHSYDFFYRMARVVAGDFTDSPGLETVTLNGPDITLHSSAGKLLGQVRAPQGFTGGICLRGPAGRGTLLLSGSPNGDDNLYRVTFDQDWTRELASLPRRGRIAEIAESIEAIARRATRWEGEAAKGQPPPYAIEVETRWLDEPAKLRGMDAIIASIRAYEKDFPYPGLRFGAGLIFAEQGPLLRPDRKPWGRDPRARHALTRDQIVEAAARLEREKTAFWAYAGHGGDPYISVEAAAAILAAAPTMCLGFGSAEDERLDKVLPYFEHHVRPILDLCARQGKMFVLVEKNTWWASIASLPQVRRLLFGGAYRSVLVPAVEDSNSRTPDLSLAGRVGLWLNGQVDRWACRIIADDFSFNRAFDDEYPMAGHPHFRKLAAHTALGASVFMINVGQRSRSGQSTRVGLESVAPFLHLLGKGVLVPPHREQLKAISPVALRVADPTPRFLASGANGHRLAEFRETDLQDWAFDRLDCYWGMAKTKPADLSAYLWSRQRQFGNFVPPTPYGFVTIAAGYEPLSAKAWTTDGDRISRGDRTFPLDEARTAILADLAAGAASFPIAVRGEVFWQLVAQEDGGYLLYLIDPGYLDPATRDVTIVPRLPGQWTTTDRITGEAVSSLRVTVPAGALRILELRPPPIQSRPE